MVGDGNTMRHDVVVCDDEGDGRWRKDEEGTKDEGSEWKGQERGCLPGQHSKIIRGTYLPRGFTASPRTKPPNSQFIQQCKGFFFNS